MTDTLEEGYEIVEVVFLGARMSSAAKNTKAIAVLNSDESYGTELWYAKLKSMVVGGVYSVQYRKKGDSTVIIHDSFKYLRRLSCQEKVAALLLEHEATLSITTALAQAEKAKKDKISILGLLRPLRQVYQKTNAAGKLAMEVRVLNYLRNGKDL